MSEISIKESPVHPDLLPSDSYIEFTALFPVVKGSGRRKILREGLKAFRKRHKMNQLIMALVFGISRQTYQILETGTGPPSPLLARQLELILSDLQKLEKGPVTPKKSNIISRG